MVGDMRLIAALLLAAPLFAQHGRYLSESKNAAIGNPQSIAAGAKLYTTSCAGCHGPDGSGGRGPNLVSRALWHPLSDENIFSAIRNGVPGADMPPTKLSDEQTWNLVAFIHVLTGPASENDVPGDVAAGQQIFWGAKAGCSNCHPIRGKGGRMGPDLSNIGSRPLAGIREAIVQPSKDLSFLGKESVTVMMKNGKTIKGIARNRSNYSLQVVDSSGTLHLISMTDVQNITASEHSLMPDDYAKRLTREEMRDLLAYLARQTTRDPESTPAKERNR
jgi:putative heme-binding domain-containing protein